MEAISRAAECDASYRFVLDQISSKASNYIKLGITNTKIVRINPYQRERIRTDSLRLSSSVCPRWNKYRQNPAV
jgi:hypothetical protein